MVVTAPFFIKTKDHGKTWERSGVVRGGSQPTMIERQDGSLLVMPRRQPRIMESESRDGGRTWGPSRRSSLKNPGAGIAMTSWAFATVFPWFPAVLSLIALLFAFSTMISWSYYGEQCWVALFGIGSVMAYKGIFLVFVWLGALFQASAVIDFGDMMILGMAFPNLIGVFLLSGKIRAELDSYWSRFRAGEFEEFE